MMWTWLPPTMRIKDPHLEFNSSEDGCSLQYMLSKIGKFETTLFIIRSTEDRVCRGGEERRLGWLFFSFFLFSFFL